MIGPPRVAISPLGIDGDWWMANAHETVLAPVGGVEQPLVQGDPRPAVPLLARLEEEADPPGQVAAAVGQQAGRAGEHGGVGVVAAGVHRRRRPRSAKSRPVSSGMGRASMSPRSRTVGPGRPPSRSATIDDSPSPVVIVSGRPSSDSSTLAWVCGRSSPSSGRRCRSRRRATTSSSRAPASANTSPGSMSPGPSGTAVAEVMADILAARPVASR